MTTCKLPHVCSLAGTRPSHWAGDLSALHGGRLSTKSRSSSRSLSRAGALTEGTLPRQNTRLKWGRAWPNFGHSVALLHTAGCWETSLEWKRPCGVVAESVTRGRWPRGQKMGQCVWDWIQLPGLCRQGHRGWGFHSLSHLAG